MAMNATPYLCSDPQGIFSYIYSIVPFQMSIGGDVAIHPIWRAYTSIV